MGKGEMAASNTVLELFQLAALLLGSEEEAVTAVERTVAEFRKDRCAAPDAVRVEAERQLVACCIRRANTLYGGLDVPPSEQRAGGAACMETEDLDIAGFSSERVTEMLNGQGRERMRRWLDGLGPAARVIFVLRAVLGRNNREAAEELRTAGAEEWTASEAGRVFRDALCSLASELAHTVAPAAA